MAEHFYSREARIDHLEIWEYIAHDNIDAADRVVGASQLQNHRHHDCIPSTSWTQNER
jgi:hypothetical protein